MIDDTDNDLGAQTVSRKGRNVEAVAMSCPVCELAAREIDALKAKNAELLARAETAQGEVTRLQGELRKSFAQTGDDMRVMMQLQGVINDLNGELSTLRESMRWIPVSERLPPIDTPVLVQCNPYPEHITCAMRYDEGDGWIWGQLTGYNATINRPDSYEFDDEYEYLAWMPLPKPEDSNDE